MGAGASASEQSQLLAEARAGGATQEEIDAYIAENNLNTAQRPAQTQPSHAQLTQMGFAPDAVAMALSLGLESMEDATQWLLDHPDAGGGDETRRRRQGRGSVVALRHRGVDPPEVAR